MKKYDSTTKYGLFFVLIFGVAFIGTIAWLSHVQRHRVEPASIYGEWIEQNVPRYVADSFEIRPSGIYQKGARVTGHYQLDQDLLTYVVGDQAYQYEIESQSKMVMKKPHHYHAVFKKQRIQ